MAKYRGVSPSERVMKTDEWVPPGQSSLTIGHYPDPSPMSTRSTRRYLKYELSALNKKKGKFSSSIHESIGSRIWSPKNRSKDLKSSCDSERNVRHNKEKEEPHRDKQERRRDEEPYRENRHEREPRRREEEPHKERRERRYEEPHHEIRRFFESPHKDEREVPNRLQHIYQGSKSIEDYHKDMKVALTRANMLESNESTMTCFLHELNRDILEIVELYYYAALDDLVHHAIKVEAQQKRHQPQRILIPMALINKGVRRRRRKGFEWKKS
ncbi:hypothetical protein CR513_33175, partial [Mucuna pruriens]